MIELEVKSGVHLLGLFTKNFIEEGTIIGVFQSREVKSQKEADGPYGCHWEDGKVVFMLDHFKYINHSSENPNVVLYDDYTVVAIKDILPGEELLSHYGDKWLEEMKRTNQKVY